MEYETLIEDIFSRHPSVQVSGFGPKSYKAGLDAMREFDLKLGSPWRNYRIIHVACSSLLFFHTDVHHHLGATGIVGYHQHTRT